MTARVRANIKEKIEATISGCAYAALMHIRVDEQATMSDIIDRAIKEYAERHHPDALLIDTGNFKNKS